MPLSRAELVARALGSLSPAERARSIVYLDEKPLTAGERVRLGDVDAQAEWPALSFFVDLQPQLNWGHECCYLLAHRDTGEISRVAAQFPPFLKATPPTLRLVWLGPEAPNWAAAVSQ